MLILPNISRTGNQTMKYDQLIKYNMRDIVLEKSYTKCDGETSPRPFFGKLKLSISLDQQSKILYSLCFFLILNWRLSKYIETMKLILSKTEFKILRKKPGDEVFRVSFKIPRRGWGQRLADFNRYSNIETRSCYSCLVL